MNELEMIGLFVSAAVVVVGFIISVGTVISKNTRATTELTCAITELRTDMTESKTHDREQDDTLANHEIRIVKLEQKGE